MQDEVKGSAACAGEDDMAHKLQKGWCCLQERRRKYTCTVLRAGQPLHAAVLLLSCRNGISHALLTLVAALACITPFLAAL
jgi:hypothetical protein